MNTKFIKSAIEAFKNMIAACGNDVCNAEDESEYTIFNGSVTADNRGNIKTYSPEGTLVAQVPLRPILDKAADFGCALVDLYEDDEADRKAKADAEAEEEAAAAEAENQEINSKIADLQQEISSLKLRKKQVRYVKRF